MKVKLLYVPVLCLILILCGCQNKVERQKLLEREQRTHQNGRDIQQYIADVKNQKEKAVIDFINSLSMEERVAQLFVVNIVGNDFFVPVEENIAGCFLFFNYNVAATVPAMINYNQSIIDYCRQNNKIPPLLSIDQEGGYVNRLRSLNGPLPSAERVSTKLSSSLARELYKYQSQQMKLLGFNLNFAPVVEVCTKDNEQFLTERSFGNLEKVLEYGTACVNAYEKNGVGTVLKHFPGNTNTDPHTGLPEIQWSSKELEMQLEPFEQLVKLNPAGILMSHARVKGYDQENPACLSKYWVTDVLRNKYNYQRLIFSDDIFMGALADNGYPPDVAVVAAIEAGIDCIMISEKRIQTSVEILCKKADSDSQFANRLDESVRRMIEYKISAGILSIQLMENGTYAVVINYPETDPDDYEQFEQIKQQNIKLYLENF
ncbi:MAG: glycoside hydrolase family 3 protein [Treponema sp.]|nr:glycoside hydrolase family 3 protein [Treponema sp.]